MGILFKNKKVYMKNLSYASIGEPTIIKETKMNVREKGHRYERELIEELNKFGFKMGSSRLMSRYYDNMGVDLVDYPDAEIRCPFHVQAKSYSTRLPYELLISDFKLKDKPIVLFHKFTKKATKNFINTGEFVILKKEDFYKLLNYDING